ncbi:1-acyl-sn-glycerol-3-phosphate acyltransferase [Streptomyces sp. NPDC048269]|uniref:lysophospholipid acyltransferase family protein n=1 Tax=Streptomyces sp. NPDC048269 TaxID=3155753 RepID=UPI00344896D3
MSVWLPTSPCTPEACTGHEGRTTSIPHAVLRLTAAIALILIGILGAPPLRILPARPRQAVVRAWSAALVRAFGIRIAVHGSPGPGGGRLVVANHISWLDIPLVAAVLPCRMLAKSDIRAWPVLGRLAGRAGTLFIERDRIRALPATVASVTEALLAGDRVTVFPEGSTWCGRAQGTFRRAAFQSALDARVLVQPIRLAYLRCDGETAGEPAFVGDDPLTASLWRIARARGIRAEVTLLPRIPPGRSTDRRDLAAAAQTAIATASHPVPLPGIPAQPAKPSATDKDSAKRPAASVHHWVNSSPAAASSFRTPS